MICQPKCSWTAGSQLKKKSNLSFYQSCFLRALSLIPNITWHSYFSPSQLSASKANRESPALYLVLSFSPPASFQDLFIKHSTKPKNSTLLPSPTQIWALLSTQSDGRTSKEESVSISPLKWMENSTEQCQSYCPLINTQLKHIQYGVLPWS